MFTHQVSLKLRTDSTEALNHKVNKIILPILRAQKGFCEEITIVAPDRLTAVLESHWNTLEDVKNYNRTGYLNVLAALSEVISSLPKARTFRSSEPSLNSINKKAA